LLYLFSFLWNVILVLIFRMVIFYMRRLAIEMHRMRTHKFFIDQHPGNNCILFIELFTNRHVPAIKKNNQSVFLFQLLQFDWDLRNNYLFYNLLQFLTFVLFITYILYKVSRSWTIGRDIFFSAEDYTNMSYYNCNISKRMGEGVITICVV
jgi:hypothetical protein